MPLVVEHVINDIKNTYTHAELRLSGKSDLIDWVGRDAVRFFLISRKADTEFVFDVDVALDSVPEHPADEVVGLFFINSSNLTRAGLMIPSSSPCASSSTEA